MELLIKVAGGAALLLWGLGMVRRGVTRAFGEKLRLWVRNSTESRLKGFLTGLTVTGILQSSSATGIMTATFASQGIVSVSSGVALMLGADVGTALVTQVLRLDLGWLSPILILVGYLAWKLENSRIHNVGYLLFGLGLVLIALAAMRGISHAVESSPLLELLLVSLQSQTILTLLVAAILTWFLHSSLGMVLITMSLVAEGVVPLNLALILVLGANIGSGVIPLALKWSDWGAGRQVLMANFGVRLAAAIVMAMVCVWFPVAQWIVQTLAGLDHATQVVMFHLFFNIVLALAVLPVCAPVSRYARVFAGTPEVGKEQPGITAKYLDPDVFSEPALALSNTTREVLRMGGYVQEMLTIIEHALANGVTNEHAQRLGELEDGVDHLYVKVKDYLMEVARQDMGKEDSRRHYLNLKFSINLEQAADLVYDKLLELVTKKSQGSLEFSTIGLRDIEHIQSELHRNVQFSLQVFMSLDVTKGPALLEAKSHIKKLEISANNAHFQRLQSGHPAARETSGLHLDLLRQFSLINSHFCSVAYDLEGAG